MRGTNARSRQRQLECTTITLVLQMNEMNSNDADEGTPIERRSNDDLREELVAHRRGRRRVRRNKDFAREVCQRRSQRERALRAIELQSDHRP